MAYLTKRVPATYDGYTIRYHHRMTRSERQLPRVSLEDLDITDVIQTLRGVAAGTDINAMYNPQHTV